MTERERERESVTERERLSGGALVFCRLHSVATMATRFAPAMLLKAAAEGSMDSGTGSCCMKLERWFK